MKLYYSKGACSLAVRIVIHELNIPCQFESVDLRAKKTEAGEDFYKINPKGAVPTLALDNHEILTENAVMQQYLADTHNAHHLLPPLGDFKRYRVLEWLNFITTELHKGFGSLFNPNIPAQIKEDIFIPILKGKLERVEQHLQNNKFLFGDHFTLPDAYLTVILIWCGKFKIELSANLKRYLAELKTRKAVHQSLEEEGLN